MTTFNFSTILKLNNPQHQPMDSVSVILQDPSRITQKGFFTGGWDGILRSYKIQPRASQYIQLVYATQLHHPILTACVDNNGLVFVGMANGDIIAVDTQNNNVLKIGGHQAPICKIFFIQNFNIVISFGYDQILRMWNINDQNGNFLCGQYNLPSKTHSVAYDHPYFMVATIQGKGYFLDLTFLPDLNIPPYNRLMDIMQAGSKIQSIKICLQKQIYAVGCADGRVGFGEFVRDNQGGLRINNQSTKKMFSKSMKKQTGYSASSPFYGQVNQIQIGLIQNKYFLIVAGTEQIAFFNLNNKDKARRVKQKCTAGNLSIDKKYYIYATGNDWCEGISELKYSKKPQIFAVRFTATDTQSFIRSP